MGKSVFDGVARDYEKIHNRSLPPGVRSEEFIAQRAASVAQWIRSGYAGGDFCYLDFGCGNGRLFKVLIESPSLAPFVESGQLRLFGVDTSVESIREAKVLVGDDRVCLVSDWSDLPRGVRFDLVVSCHVFHHIVPAERGAAAKTLRAWMKPGSKLVVWEHNPFNPFTRLIVKACPFDKDARLLKYGAVKALFEAHAFRRVRHAYVNVFPPRWLRLKLLSIVEKKLTPHPVGAQYWVMFEKHE
jgi:SAM-dependent methyltransferase